MKTINISVRDKLPLVTSMSGRAVADNRYRLQFDFDDEWVEGLKTVVVAVSAKQYRMYPTTADYVDIELSGERYITVGVLQDTVATSRPCQILVNESIRQHMGDEIKPPEPDVWTYITDQIRTLNSMRLYPVEKTAAMTQQVGVDAERRLWTYPGGSGGSGGIDRISIVSSTPSDGPTEYILRVHMTDGRAIDCKLPNMGIALADIITVSPSSPLETAEVGQVGELWFDTTMRMLYVCIMAGTAIGAPNWIAVGGSSSPGGGNSSGGRGVMDVVFSAVSAETNGTWIYDMVVSLEDGTKITRRLPGFRNKDVVMFHNGAPSETLSAPRGKLLFDTDRQNMYVCADISGNGSDTKTIWKPISASGVHVSTDTPPAGTRVWVNPNGNRTKIPQIDETLAKPGYAADAKAVGEKINQLSGEIADKLDAKELTEAINTALAHAKESGEFDGEPGAPGTTPHIGANGNWWIGNTDTGVKAQGEDGDDYNLTDADKLEIAEEAAKLVEIPGAGNIELIEFITLTEDTSSIVREVMPDGTPYGFKSVFAVISPVQVWSNKWVKTSAYYDKATYGFDPSIPNISPDAPNKKAFTAHKAFNLDGQLNNPIHAGVLETGGIILSLMSYGQTNPGYHNSFQTSIAAKIGYNTNKAKIIKFELTSEVPLVSGTRVLLFGVRA